MLKKLLLHGSLPIAVCYLYIRHLTAIIAREKVIELVHDSFKELEKILKEISCMNKMTIQAALNKLNEMTFYIGYPDELTQESYVSAYYQNLEVDPKNYLSSALNLTLFSTDYAFNELRKLVD